MKMLFKGTFLAAITVFLDQWSKLYVFDILDKKGVSILEITPFFNIVKVYNYGVSFGMFNDIPYGRLILSLIALFITIALCVWLARSTRWHMGAALGLIIGGAIGNIIDRVRFGAVADFLDFYIGNFHWPAFNVADSAICIGVIIIAIDSLIYKEEKR